MSEQELRDRLRAEVDFVEAPADLALRAEQGWRRRRRNQAVVAGATLAVLAVVGGVVAALPRPAPAPVAAPSADGCAEQPAPAEPAPAPVTTDTPRPPIPRPGVAAPPGWAFRGDQAKAKAVVGLGVADLDAKRATAVLPLLAQRPVTETTPNTWVYALALAQPSGWHVRIGAAEYRGGRFQPVDDVLVPLPPPAAGTTVSAFVSLTGGLFAGPNGSALVVLGAAGTDRIDYEGCRDGRTFSTGATGDTLVLTTGPLDGRGRLTVRAGGRVVSTGPPRDASLLPLATPAPTDVSAYGARLAGAEIRMAGRSEQFRSVHFTPYGATPGRVPAAARAVVLGACAGRVGARFDGVPFPCDGRTYQVWTGVLEWEQLYFDLRGLPDPATDRTSVSVTLTVVAP